MSAPRTIAMAVMQSERRHRQVAQEIRQLQDHRRLAAQQLEQLESYAHETQQNFLRYAQRHLQPVVLQQHHQFVGRLDDAIDRQSLVIDALQMQIVKVQNQLLACEQRLNVLQRWMDRQASQRSMIESRREQKVNDDLALHAGPSWLSIDRGEA